MNNNRHFQSLNKPYSKDITKHVRLVTVTSRYQTHITKTVSLVALRIKCSKRNQSLVGLTAVVAL